MTKDADRTVMVSGDIDEDLYKGFIEKLVAIDNTPGPITVLVASEGGLSNIASAMWEAIRECRNEVTTVAYGEVASSAFFVFQAGHKRLIGPLAVLMWHDGWMKVRGKYTADELDRKRRSLLVIDQLQNRALAERTGISLKTIENWSKAETFWTAEEAVKVGLADALTR